MLSPAKHEQLDCFLPRTLTAVGVEAWLRNCFGLGSLILRGGRIRQGRIRIFFFYSFITRGYP